MGLPVVTYRPWCSVACTAVLRAPVVCFRLPCTLTCAYGLLWHASRWASMALLACLYAGRVSLVVLGLFASLSALQRSARIWYSRQGSAHYGLARLVTVSQAIFEGDFGGLLDR